jgi:adenylate cyclase
MTLHRAGDEHRPSHTGFDDETARSVLTGQNRGLRFGRRVFSHVPSYPRCKLCASPFGGLGGQLMRLVGKGRWPKNPKYCSACFKQLSEHRAGAEIECSLLFADVRGSTTMAESMRPAEFRGLMDRFFEVATDVLVDHDAIVDKYVGDEVIALFIPALNGELHARRAIEAGQSLLVATGAGANGPSIPVGVGVNTGVAFVGAVGAGDNVEMTAMGDAVNVAARLASAAAQGELLVTVAAAEAAKLAPTGLEHRSLELKGKSEATEVLVIRPAVSQAA